MTFKRGNPAIRKNRINREIRAQDVRLIGENGEPLGIVPLSEALKIALECNSDLVEIAPAAVPPVCRVLDYGKFKYEQAKKERDSHKRQKSAALRRVQLRPKIGEHDLAFKIDMARKLLDGGDKVKVSVIFRGREIIHPELGAGLLERVSRELGDSVSVEKPPSMEGRILTTIFYRKKQQKGEKSTGS